MWRVRLFDATTGPVWDLVVPGIESCHPISETKQRRCPRKFLETSVQDLVDDMTMGSGKMEDVDDELEGVRKSDSNVNKT